MRQRLFLLFLFPFFSLISLTATPSEDLKGTVTGVVIDASTGTPLDYATISLYDQSTNKLVTGGISAEDGSFSFTVKAGTYYAQIDFLAYKSLTVNDISVAGNGETKLGSLGISPESTALEEVIVTAEKSQMSLSLDKKVFNVGKDLSSRGGNAAELLDNVPSVQVDVEGNVSLRGSGNVRILVNGRPSGLVGDGAGGLRALPANLIESIEVVTNPSARYEAEGTAGIINIILKKEQRKGLNGSFDLTLGVPETYGAAINLSKRSSKINFFTNLGVNYRTGPGNGSLYQETYTPDATLISLQNNVRERGGLGGSLRFGADYFLTPRSTLTTALSYRLGDDDNFNTTTYRDFLNNLSNPTGSEIRTDKEAEDESNLEYALTYKLTFPDNKDQSLVIDVRYEDETETESSALRNQFFLANGLPSGTADQLQRSANTESENVLVAKVDFVRPFGKDHQLEAGGRVSVRNIDNDFTVEEFSNDSEQWEPLAGLTNNFLYDEAIYAAYLTYGKKVNKFSYQFGLRPEYSKVSTNLLTTNEVNERDYLNVFPSAFFSYDLPKDNAVQVSYSRRVQRPRFWDLNPFFTFTDNRNFFSGNPDLDPEFSHSLELNHIKYFTKGSFSSGIYYRHTDGVRQRIRTVAADGTSVTRPENLATEKAYGFEFTASYEFFKWWRFNTDFNAYGFQIDGSNLDRDFSAEDFTWFTRGTSRFKISPRTDVQVRFDYRAARKETQGTRKSITSIDLAASQDFLKDKATLTLSVRDLLNSRRWRYTSSGENFFAEGDRRWRARTVTLTLNYRLNEEKKRSRGGDRGGDYDGGEGGSK